MLGCTPQNPEPVANSVGWPKLIESLTSNGLRPVGAFTRTLPTV